MTKTKNVLQRWLAIATPDERDRLAELSETSAEYLRLMAHGYRTEGELRLSAELAKLLEIATTKHKWRAELFPLYREQLAPVCMQCEYAKKCGNMPKKGKTS